MLDTLHDLILDHLERESTRMADYVVSPTDYMLDWFYENGWPMDAEDLVVAGGETKAKKERGVHEGPFSYLAAQLPVCSLCTG